MLTALQRIVLAAGFVLPSLCAFAAEPVKRIDIYVQPYYQAAKTPSGRPKVAVGKTFDRLLGSNQQKDILTARDLIVAKPSLVTPMTLMVLAVRLYDVGLRDESVFWFYAAKDRYVTLSGVVDVAGSSLSGVEDAVASFATLAGPVINGYAFCDLAKQRERAAPRPSNGWRRIPTTRCSCPRFRPSPETAASC
jgi:hypothetical protein